MQDAFVLFELMNHMVLIAQEAKRRGQTVIALNHDPLRTEGPFAVPADLVDEVIEVRSWSDPAELAGHRADLARRYRVRGTYAAFEAALRCEAAVREDAGLPNNGSRNLNGVLDKAQVRQRLQAAGLTQLNSTTLTEAVGWSRWPGPGRKVIKPANGTGSALCFIVSTLTELRGAADQIAAGHVVNPLMREYIFAHGDFVVEDEAPGELLSAECLLDRGEVHVVGLMGRYVLASDPVVEMGFQFPYPHPRAVEIEASVKQFHHLLGLCHGPTQIELMVPETGPIELIDLNARLAGTASIICFSRAFGLDYARTVTDLACGQTPDWSKLVGTNRFAAEMFVLPPTDATVMGQIEFPPGVECARVMKPVGQRLTQRADQLDVIAMFVVVADSAAELHERAMTARREVRFDGRPIPDTAANALQPAPHIGRTPSIV